MTTPTASQSSAVPGEPHERPLAAARRVGSKVDHEHDLTSAELAYLRGPYVRRPNENANAREWIRWAEEIEQAHQSAKLLLDAQAAKAARPIKRRL